MPLQKEIEELGPWFHNVHLPQGAQTAPHHFLGDFPKFKWDKIKGSLPGDLSGWRVLDIGCNAGFYSVELAKLGAEVLGIDLDMHYLKQAEWIAKKFDLSHKIKFRQMQVYDLAQLDEKFDMVWFMGVFYHLRYPLLALDIVSRKVSRILVFQTLSRGEEEEMEIPEDVEFSQREILSDENWPSMAFIENKMAGDPTNWWVPNHQGIISLLRNCGFRIIARPEHEVYVATFENGEISNSDTWNSSEYLSATGNDWIQDVEKKTGKK